LQKSLFQKTCRNLGIENIQAIRENRLKRILTQFDFSDFLGIDVFNNHSAG